MNLIGKQRMVMAIGITVAAMQSRCHVAIKYQHVSNLFET